MFSFYVGQTIYIDDKKYSIESRVRKENREMLKTYYICLDEIGDIHKFDEEFLVNNYESH